MPDTNGELRFGALAREVFSWDAAIRWIAVDEPGRQSLLQRRDPDTGAAAATPGYATRVDPLLLMMAEEGRNVYSGGREDRQQLRFVVLAYRDRAQIVTNFGRYGQLNVGIGLTGNAYQVGNRLAGLLDAAGDARIDANDNLLER